MDKNLGFTLAELLLTLTVVGVVAALTIPALLQSANNAEFTAKLKSDFSYLNQAVIRIATENGGDPSLAFGTSHDNMLTALGNKLVFAQTCSQGTQAGVCWHNGNTTWKNLYGNNGWADLTPYSRAVMNDGSMIAVANSNAGCAMDYGTGPLNNAVCGWVMIDINGFKGPNVVGRDIFAFWITRTGVYPYGSDGDALSNWDIYCNKTNPIAQSGESCAAKLLQGGIVQ